MQVVKGVRRPVVVKVPVTNDPKEVIDAHSVSVVTDYGDYSCLLVGASYCGEAPMETFDRSALLLWGDLPVKDLRKMFKSCPYHQALEISTLLSRAICLQKAFKLDPLFAEAYKAEFEKWRVRECRSAFSFRPRLSLMLPTSCPSDDEEDCSLNIPCNQETLSPLVLKRRASCPDAPLKKQCL